MASQIIKAKLLELQKSNHSQSSQPKIQKVAGHLRDRKKFKEHYLPKLVSIGPIHHGNTNLKLGEKYKLVWAANYIKDNKQSAEDLYQKIAGKIDELKGHFDDEVLTLTSNSLEAFGSLEEKMSWILFMDGCSLLHILEAKVEDDERVLLMRDMLLLENQLPFDVLMLLWKDNDESELIKKMMDFFKDSPWGITLPDKSQSEKEKDEVPNREHSVSISTDLQKPTHLLDVHRKKILNKSNFKTKNNEAINKKWSQKLLKIKTKWNEVISKKWSQKLLKENLNLMTLRSILDLRARGIILKPSATLKPTEIEFSTGWFFAELILPKFVVEDISAAIFLNLIAYEMCPDFENDKRICSFVSFMNALIDHPEDVKELRSKEILLNCLGSDEEVANLFNIMGTDMTYNACIYGGVINKIHDHYCNKYKTWIAMGFHTYFNTPWAIMAFLAAFIALALTFIQTLFTIKPTSK